MSSDSVAGFCLVGSTVGTLQLLLCASGTESQAQLSLTQPPSLVKGAEDTERAVCQRECVLVSAPMHTVCIVHCAPQCSSAVAAAAAVAVVFPGNRAPLVV